MAKRSWKWRWIEFEQAVNLLSRTLTNQGLVSNEGEAVARVISHGPDLASNESAARELGDEILKKIAVEIADKLRKSTTVDWHVRATPLPKG